MSYALVLALILSTLIFEFVKYEKGLSDPLAILWRGLTFDPVRNTSTYAVLGLIVSVWIVAIVLTFSEMTRSQVFGSSNSRREGSICLAAVPIALSALFALGLAIELGAMPYIPVPAQRIENVQSLATQAVGIVDYYTIALFLLLLMVAIALMLESKLFSRAWSVNKWALIAFVPAVAMTLLWINVVNLNPIRADDIYRLGKVFDDQSDWNAATALYKRAIGLAPANDAYYMTLARALQQKSVLANTTAASLFNDKTLAPEILSQDDQRAAGLNRLDLLYASQALLLRARELNPLYLVHTINLARFYHPELPVATPDKTKLVDLANQYYVEAQRLDPNSVPLWNERADFDLTYKNDPDAAIQKLNESLARNVEFEQTYLGLGKAYAAKKELTPAIQAYQKALALDPKSAEAEGKLAFLYYQQGQANESVQAYVSYINLAPDAQNVWEAHKNLALIYEQEGNLDGAVRQAQLAASLAPKEYVAELNDLVSQMQKQ
jgi:tetratricopeptide (TPR) repeat protein